MFAKPLLSIISCLPLCLSAEHAASHLLVQWDNDLLTGSDRDYTNGARVAYMQDLNTDQNTHSFLQNLLFRFAGTDDESFLADYRYLNDGDTRFSWGTGVTQLMFTPDAPEPFAAPDGERPYAGWLGLEFSLHVKNQISASSVTLSLGTTGPNSYADDAQNWIHQNVSGSPLYQGWKSQVPGEFTANLHLDHKRRIEWLDSDCNSLIEFDGYYEWGAALGNFRTDAYIGSLIRLGHNLPSSYITPRVQIGSYGHALFEEETESDFSIFTFVGLRGSAVLHDITLDGPVFRDFDTGIDSEALVGELLFGAGIHWSYFDVSLSRTIRTDEFKGQDANQEFGSVLVRFQWPW